jgi:hypothetical protein
MTLKSLQGQGGVEEDRISLNEEHGQLQRAVTITKVRLNWFVRLEWRTLCNTER